MRKISRPSSAVEEVKEDERETSDKRCPQCSDEIFDDRGCLRRTIRVAKHSGTDEDLLSVV